MKRCMTILLLGATVLSGVSCARLFGTDRRNNAYLTSHNGEPLVVPKDLSTAKISHQFDVPYVSGKPVVNDAPPGNIELAKVQDRKIAYLPGIAARDIRWMTKGGRVALLLTHDLNQAYLIADNGLRRQQMSVISRDKRRHRFTIKDTDVTGGKIGPNTPSYDIVLSAYGRGHTLISISSATGHKVQTQTVRRLLKSLANGMQGKSDFSLKRWFSRR